ncbi:MAG: DNRLRE domain-containing protein [Xanthomonadales bacterium]|nr:DNRLRE domain-containing protein [Xanthomonadales bacterium]
MKTMIKGWVLLALMAFSLAGWAQTVTRGPYLQSLDEDGLIVRWRTDLATDSVVRYGTDSATLNQTVTVGGSRTEHSVVLGGLNPATQYFYSVGDSLGTIAGDASYFFSTAPIPGTAANTRIWVIGDSGTADANARAVRDAFKAWSASSPADFMVMLGDNAYNDGTDAEYQAAVFDTYPELLRQLPVWSTLGNHDGHTADSATQSGPYYDIFDFPTAGEVGGLASGTEAYFSWDYGNIHFVNLDSYETDRSVGGNMLQWLESDLAFNDKPWVVAIWHHPPYTKGSHNSDTEGRLIDMRQNALPILEAWGVDLVLAGHSHSYERSYLLDGHYGSSTTLDPVANVLNPGDGSETGDGAYAKPDIVAAENEGAVYAVAGSSGKISGGSLNHPAMYVSINFLGSMVLDVSGNRLDAVFIDDTGLVRDEFTLLKTPDNDAPMIDLARAEDATHVRVDYSERVDAGTAGNVANYAIAGLAISNAAVLAGNREVRLTTSAMTPGQGYVLTVNNVQDESGNTIAPNSQYAFDFLPEVTVSFQDGLAPDPGYAGTADAYIREASATTNYGAATTLQVDGDEPSGSGSDMSIVLAWDVSEIPASATVQSASIHLNTLNVGGPYSCYALLRAWDEAQVTWNQAAGGSAWGTPGALAGSDRDAAPVCTFNAGSTGALEITLNGDGLAMLQGWVDGGLANNGIVISDSVSNNGADFDSSESASAMSRPRLEVTYTLAGNQAPDASFGHSCTDLDCDFSDTSTDADGSVVAWDWDFGDGATSTAQNPSHSYAAAGDYTVQLTVTDDGGATDVASSLVSVTEPPGSTEVVASADVPGAGTVSGNYTATHADGGAVQSIEERQSGGKKQNRYSYLQHGWQFNLPPSGLATVHVNAWSSVSTDDQFRFSWSADGNNYTEMFVVSSTDPGHMQSFVLPAGTSGTVYLRVEDTDQGAGNQALDTVFVDHLYILAEAAAGDPPAAPTALAANAAGASAIDLAWTDNATDETGFSIERSTDGAVFTEVAVVPADAVAYTDSGLAGDTPYWYQVRAFNGAGNSAYSNVASATTEVGAAISLGLNGYKVKGVHHVDLSWSGTTAATVDVFRDGQLVANVPDTGAYTDNTGNKGGRSYDYQVCEGGTANCSDIVSIAF